MVWGNKRSAQRAEHARGRLARLLGENPGQLVGRTELIAERTAPSWPTLHCAPTAPTAEVSPTAPVASGFPSAQIVSASADAPQPSPVWRFGARTATPDAQWLFSPHAQYSDPVDAAPSALPVQPVHSAGPDRGWQSDHSPWWQTIRLDPTRRGVAVAAITTLVVLVIAGALFGVKLWRADAAESAPVPLPQVTSAESGVSKAPPGAQPGSPEQTHELVVAVSGKVSKPGLVRVPDGSRVADAISAAGGALPGAPLDNLNLARKLVDGELIVVGAPQPEAAAPPESAADGTAVSPSGVLLDLNSATLAQLDALPGVGPITAQRILDYRTEHGRFESVGQLRQVDGIGEVKFAKLKPLVTV